MKDENRTKAELIAELQSLRSIVDRSSDGIALPQSTDLFRLAFRTSPDGFMISRLDDWLVIDVNDAFCEITGFSRAEVTGAVGNEVNIWASPEDRARAQEDKPAIFVASSGMLSGGASRAWWMTISRWRFRR